MSLSVVHPPRGTTTTCTLDIVAVHGLSGDAIDTWTHPKSNAFWLKDFLPHKVKDARILTFGYDAAAAFGQSTADVIDHAKSLLSSLIDKRDEEDEKERPIIFVAHSLGGIVVKQALLQARLEPQYKAIQDATLGILFFGTPHRGSDKATYGKVLATVAQKLSHRPSPRLIKALETNSDVLLRLTSDFKFQLPRYRVVSFYEQRPMGPLASLVVEKHSALLEVDKEDQVPVNADHSQICKFEKEDDDTFEKTWKRIERIRKETRPASTGQTVPRNKHFEVPQSVSPMFTGQAQIGRRLETVFAPSSHERSKQRRFVLFGMGGSGKTQICLQYVYTHRDRYWGVFWIDASSHDSIILSIKQMASVLGLEQNTECVRRELANTTHTWLIVFDNADNPKVSLTGYFPTGGRGDVIITSRNPVCHQYSTVGSEEIGRMTHDEAHVLLSKTAYGQVDISKDIATALGRVVEVLGCLALAVAQAGAYIRETQCTLVEYLQIYDRRHEELLSFLPTHSGTDYKHTVYTTWQVSIDAITSTPGEVSAGALRIVRLVCFLHYDQIPLEVFFRASNARRSQEDTAWLPWPSSLTDPFDVRCAVREAVALLASFSLLKRDTDASLSLHPLVHEWCRKRISEDEQRICCLHTISLLGRSVNWDFTIEEYIFRRKMVTHVQTCLQQWEDVQGGIVESRARHWGALALVLSENGFTSKAIQLEEPLLQLRKSKLGPHHPDTISSMNNLANRLAEAGRREEALKLSEEVLQLEKSKLGPHHPDTIQSMHNLTIRYSEAGRREEALKLSEEVVQLMKSKLGADHPDTSSATKLHTDLPMPVQDPYATNIESGNSRPRMKNSRSCWRCL